MSIHRAILEFHGSTPLTVSGVVECFFEPHRSLNEWQSSC